ncbi:tRNA (adenosine(37)-N6)-threonylcarbamoyltransferase complex dimerization subunit type 1 TsaB [Buchnera aphidicola (Periphyllus koelreuteriae)]|uniref:tRNA (adenosine(37)-N6)-threonylcarbamoyltransferase complex dimerization subunit type 1 TsaB n=1 Tax=Buchnera aphidicola TaxID=9 RepID=UPI0031B8158A
MKLLTFYNSKKICSVAIKYNNKIDYIYEFSEKNNHSIILLMINKILLKNFISLKDINYIAFSKGPGSFTGIRIAIIIARGLSIGLNIPLIGISTLKIFAEKGKHITKKNKFLIITKANKTNIYFGKYIYKKNNIFLINKEKFISIQLALCKIKKLKNWIIIKNFNSIKFNSIKNIKILNIKNINALDIIPIALRYIKFKRYKKKIIVPNYLQNKII